MVIFYTNYYQDVSTSALSIGEIKCWGKVSEGGGIWISSRQKLFSLEKTKALILLLEETCHWKPSNGA